MNDYITDTIVRETRSTVYNAGLVADQMERVAYQFDTFVELYRLFWQLPPSK
jgi:hypothetical protein